MIGNDVVDLGDADCLPGGLHPRFDARVFSRSELALLDRCADRDRTRWALWAAKESAYKAARRLDPRTVFSPSRFVVELHDENRATVFAGGRLLVVELVATPRYVHAVAHGAGAGAAHHCSAVARLDPDRTDRTDTMATADTADTMATTASAATAATMATMDQRANRPSIAVRSLALATLAQALSVAPGDLVISREGRVPMLYLRARRDPIALSLSHHGRFVAFACALPSSCIESGSRAATRLHHLA